MISSDFEFADFSESHEVKSLLVLFFLLAALWARLIVPSRPSSPIFLQLCTSALPDWAFVLLHLLPGLLRYRAPITGKQCTRWPGDPQSPRCHLVSS